MKTSHRRHSQSGFTIIELLIATAVFAIVLIVVTTGIMQFSRQYYKGVISSKTQNTARAIIDELARAIQFNGGQVNAITGPNGAKGFCVGGSKRYSYVHNTQLTDGPAGPNQDSHALISDNISGCGGGTPAVDVSSKGLLSGTERELLNQHMRLSKFTIDENNDLYTISVRVVYGDNDLLCSPAISNNCNDPAASFPAAAMDLTCKQSAASQFCAASELTTTVKKRVN